MCAIAMGLLAGGLQFAGAGLAAYGQHEQGQYQDKMAKYQAGLDRERAKAAQENADAESVELGARRRAMLSEARVEAAGSGAMLDSSPNDSVQTWERDLAYTGAYETAKIKRNADLESWGFLASAEAAKASGKMARWSGNLAAAGSLIGGAGSSAGTGFSTYSALK